MVSSEQFGFMGLILNKGSINCKKIRFVSTSNTYLTERRLTDSA